MPITKPLKSLTLPAYLLASLVFVLLVAGCEWLLHEYRLERSAELSTTTQRQWRATRASIENELSALVSLSNGLASHLTAKPGKPNNSQTRTSLAEAFRYSRHVRSFALAVGYDVADVFPQNETGPAIGVDIREQTAQWPSIQHSIATRSPVLEAPTPQLPNPAYLVPIFTEDGYWGMLSAVIDESSLFSTAGLKHSHEFEYAVKTQPGNRLLLGSADLFANPQAVRAEFAVPGGNWWLAVKSVQLPEPAWPVMFRGLGWFLSAAFAAQTLLMLRMRQQLAQLALFDPLTGLPTRHLFFDRLKQLIRRTKRNRGNFSVLFVCLNDLHPANHRQGDKVKKMLLTGIGKRLIGSVRHCDTVTRWGVEEFLVLLDACPTDQAQIIAESLRHHIELPVPYGELELRVGARIGIATFPEDGRSLSALLNVAGQRASQDSQDGA